MVSNDIASYNYNLRYCEAVGLQITEHLAKCQYFCANCAKLKTVVYVNSNFTARLITGLINCVIEKNRVQRLRVKWQGKVFQILRCHTVVLYFL